MKKLLFTLLGLAAALTLPGPGFQDHAWPVAVRHDRRRRNRPVDYQQTRFVVGRGNRGRRTQFLRRRTYPPLRNRRGPQTGAPKTLHAVRLNNLRPGTKYCYRIFSQEVLEWKHGDNVLYGRTVAQQCLQTRAVPVPDIPGNGNRLFVRHPERHPRTRRRHDRTVPGNQFRQTRLRNAQRRHVQQH